ncbi:hypothetical protein [Pyruvatibacter sp.]
MGSLFKSKDKQTSTSSQGPWGPQQDYIKGALSDAKALYDQHKGGLDEKSLAALDGLYNFATGDQLDFAQSQMDLANSAGGAFDQYLGNTNSLYDFAQQDGTQSIIDNAALYADNPYMDGMIDSVGRDVSRSLGEDVLPGLNRSASMGGNLNSSRAGAAEAIAKRGARDRLADVSSGMRGNAYNTGLSMSATERQNRFGNMMNANSGLFNAAQFGQQAGQAGIANTQNAYNTAVSATEAPKDAKQAALTNYWNMISSPLGSEGTSTTTKESGGNIGGKLLGAAISAGSMFATGGASAGMGGMGSLGSLGGLFSGLGGGGSGGGQQPMGFTAAPNWGAGLGASPAQPISYGGYYNWS